MNRVLKLTTSNHAFVTVSFEDKINFHINGQKGLTFWDGITFDEFRDNTIKLVCKGLVHFICGVTLGTTQYPRLRRRVILGKISVFFPLLCSAKFYHSPTICLTFILWFLKMILKCYVFGDFGPSVHGSKITFSSWPSDHVIWWFLPITTLYFWKCLEFM